MVDVLIVKLTGYCGDDTVLSMSPDPLFMVVDAKTGRELDNGYRSFSEAQDAWADETVVILNTGV